MDQPCGARTDDVESYKPAIMKLTLAELEAFYRWLATVIELRRCNAARVAAAETARAATRARCSWLPAPPPGAKGRDTEERCSDIHRATDNECLATARAAVSEAVEECHAAGRRDSDREWPVAAGAGCGKEAEEQTPARKASNKGASLDHEQQAELDEFWASWDEMVSQDLKASYRVKAEERDDRRGRERDKRPQPAPGDGWRPSPKHWPGRPLALPGTGVTTGKLHESDPSNSDRSSLQGGKPQDGAASKDVRSRLGGGGPACGPQGDLTAFLAQLCGKWADTKGSLYSVWREDDASLSVWTKRPDHTTIYTKQLIWLSNEQIVWGAKSSFLLRCPRPDATEPTAEVTKVTWARPGDTLGRNAFTWTRHGVPNHTGTTGSAQSRGLLPPEPHRN